MIKASLSKLVIVGGGLALSLGVGAGVASATPDLGPAVNTTCSYPQIVSAVNAQGPEIATAFNQSPQLQVGVQAFLASGPAKRQQMAQEFANAPGIGPYLPAIQNAFATCNSF